MKFIDRDISWLFFNARILQEVENQSTPLMERLKFVAIYSSNLEEFYRVRVASQRFIQNYEGDKKNKFAYRSSKVLQQINIIVSEQQRQLGRLFYQNLIPEMEKEGIKLITDHTTEIEKQAASEYFDANIREHIQFQEITHKPCADLKNQAVYLYIICGKRLFLSEIEYDKFGRFITLKENTEVTTIIQLDDIIKKNIPKLFDDKIETFAIKISRDAELYIDEEQDEDLVKKIEKSLKKRNSGLPSRLLFDENVPFKYIDILRKKAGLDMSALIPGGKYHNFYGFFDFPVFKSKPHLYNKPQDSIPVYQLETSLDWFKTIKMKDVFLSFPYQSFDYVTSFLDQAADDPYVKEIDLTIYRVSNTSAVCQSLEKAALNGKKVFVLVEVLARFDEASNIYWGDRLTTAGAIVKYSTSHLKVHAKTFSILREEEDGQMQSYAYLGTGNLNEKTSKIYADHGLLTADKKYTDDLIQVFNYLKKESNEPVLKHLLVAPFNLRNTLESLIDQEIAFSKNNLTAKITIKINSLEDPDMISKLREAADAGVEISMIVRGICCYKPLNKSQKKNIKIISIVDQYLEHTRIYHFHNNGNNLVYLCSADLMTRNLSKRIEVAFPIQNNSHKSILIREMQIQLNDNVKGRIVSEDGSNIFVKGDNKLSSQQLMYSVIHNKAAKIH